MDQQLPFIPSHTCRHHCSTPFPPPSEHGVEDSAEQSQFFREIAFWILQKDKRVGDPVAEMQKPMYDKILKAVRRHHYGDHRFLRLTVENLRLGKSAGCVFCLRIDGKLRERGCYGPSYTQHFPLLACGNDIVRIWELRPYNEWDADGTYLGYRVCLLEMNVWYPSEQRHLLTNSATLEDVLSRTRTWLHTCTDNHSNCAHRTVSFVPTRVLEITSYGGSMQVRLMEPTECLPSYVTLSYCWGVDIQPAWLTNALLQQYKQGINIASLPHTIKDAIIVTRGLHIRHIWIDALCIIQDNEIDKNREIDQMGNIYECSTITILAARAPSVTSGFLNFTDDSLEGSDLPWVLEMNEDILINRGHGHITKSRIGSIVLVPQTPDLETIEEPLSLRAWALQERLLSRRTISFGLSDITWACGTSKEATSFRERHKFTLHPKRVDPEEGHPRFWPECWANLMRNYSRLTIRYPKDRLPALAGIAQRWSDGLDDSYVAGLWRSSLPEALLWYVPDRAPAINHNHTPFAPSWSWAAFTGPVEFSAHTRFPTFYHAEILDVDITHESPGSLYGAVTTGVVRLLGVLTPARLEPVSTREGCKVLVDDDSRAEAPGMAVWLDRDIPVHTAALFILPLLGYLQLAPGSIDNLLVSKNADGTFSRLGVVFVKDQWQCLLTGSKQRIELI